MIENTPQNVTYTFENYNVQDIHASKANTRMTNRSVPNIQRIFLFWELTLGGRSAYVSNETLRYKT